MVELGHSGSGSSLSSKCSADSSRCCSQDFDNCSDKPAPHDVHFLPNPTFCLLLLLDSSLSYERHATSTRGLRCQSVEPCSQAQVMPGRDHNHRTCLPSLALQLARPWSDLLLMGLDRLQAASSVMSALDVLLDIVTTGQ